MNKICVGVSLSLLLLFTGNSAFATNILVNPGFESGALSPWYQAEDLGGPENWNVTNADAHSGVFSATDDGNKLIIQDFTAVSVADILEASFWLKNDDAAINAVLFKYSDGSTGGDTWNPTDNSWNYVNATSWLTPGKSLVSFGVYGYISSAPSGEDRTYVDDWILDVKPVPEPTTMLLLGTGLVGVAGAARKRKKNQA